MNSPSGSQRAWEDAQSSAPAVTTIVLFSVVAALVVFVAIY
jgi:hypothetical protein